MQFMLVQIYMNYLKIPLGHKVTHSLDYPDSFSVRLCQSGKKNKSFYLQTSA